MAKKKVLILAFILILSMAGLAACSSTPSIYGNLNFNNDRVTVFFLVEDRLAVVPAQTVDPNTVITLPDVEIEGNRFLGWSTYSSNDQYPMPAGTEYVVRSSIILYAVLEINNFRMVTFNVKGDLALVKSKYCVKGSDVTLPKAAVASHTFKGWSEYDPDDKYPMAANTSYTVTRDITLYAVLEKNPPPYNSATVEFSVDGDIRNRLTRVVDAGDSIELPVPDVEKIDQRFLGWVTSEDDIGTVRTAGSRFVANRDAVLYAQYSSMLVVVFDIEGEKEIIKPAIASAGSTIILPKIDLPQYELIGWSEKGPDDLDPMSAGSAYKVSENIILYAVIKPKVLVSFDVNLNGVDYNKDGENVPKMYVGKGETFTLPDLKVPIDGFTLLGWNTEPKETGYYKVGSRFSVDADTVFYAVLSAEIKISFEVFHEGKNLNPDHDNPASMVVNSGQQVTLPKFEIEGYTFTGWQDKDSEIVYSGGKQYSFVKDMELTALFAAQALIKFDIHQNDVDYNENGKNISPILADVGSYIILPGDNLVPGYRLLGWSKNGPDDANPISGNYLVDGDKTLYAVLGELVAIAFSVNGNFNVITPIMAAVGEQISLPNPTYLTNGDYSFGGWTLDPMDRTKLTNPYKVTGYVTLYPIWELRATVSYYIFNTFFRSETVLKYSYLTLPEAEPPYTGYTVLGWSYNSSYDYENYIEPGKEIQITEDTKLYLVCSYPVMVYFSVNQDYSVIPQIKCDINSKITLPDLSLQGYDLAGWYLSQNFMGATYSAGSIYTVIDNTTFYAKLRKTQVFTEFSVNGSVIPSLTQNAVLDSEIILPDPDVAGYILLGWTVSADGKGNLLLPLSKYKATESRTLYAKLEVVTENYSFAIYGDNEYIVDSYEGNATKLTIPSVFNGGKVVGIGIKAFYGNQTIVSVTLPESVKFIGDYVFSDAYNLENINLENVEFIGNYAFMYAEKLKISSLNTIRSLISIGESAFYGACVMASDSTATFILTPKIEYIGNYAFAGWINGAAIDITAVNKKYENYDYYWVGNNIQLIDNNTLDFAFQFDNDSGECTIISYHGSSTIVIIPEQVYFYDRYYKVTAIAESAFSNNATAITKVIMGANIVSIGKDAFKNNFYISTVVFNNLIIIEDVADAFYGTAWYIQQMP